MARLRALPLVAASDELTGALPAAFERAIGRAAPGDSVHRGLVHVAANISLNAILSATPPSAHSPVREALAVLDDWQSGAVDSSQVARARAQLFEALLPIEKLTRSALRASFERLAESARPKTPVDAHADAAAIRFAVLGAHYAVSTLLLTLDGVTRPRDLVAVPAQAAGALAYHFVGLGPARSPSLRAKAWEQAAWEADRPGCPEEQSSNTLALQVFHEYLGATWKDVSDAQRLEFFELVEWALPASLRPS